MLGVNSRRFAWRNTKELSIEPVDVFYEPSPAGVDLTRFGQVRIEVLVNIEMPIGYFSDGIASVAQKFPEFLGRIHIPGKTTRYADDRDAIPISHWRPSPVCF